MYHQSIQLCIKKEKNKQIKYNAAVVNMQGITANWDWDPSRTLEKPENWCPGP